MNRNRGSKFSGAWRFLTITRVMIKYGMADITARVFNKTPKADDAASDTPAATLRIPSPVRIRQALEDLGPSFIKLGQLMSTRADVFPPAYIDEFRKLQDSVAPFPFRQARRVVEAELKRPLQEVFADFEPDPQGAASVAQVHKARLYSGDQVAVKIIRPGNDRIIQKDIRLMYYFAGKLENCLLYTTDAADEYQRE